MVKIGGNTRSNPPHVSQATILTMEHLLAVWERKKCRDIFAILTTKAFLGNRGGFFVFPSRLRSMGEIC
jgi:S-ribosylhomocysteine lyase LuxS involved in autoinducer biosynthesis